MQTLVINEFGTFLGKRSERVLVKRSDGTEEEYPLFRLSEIVVARKGVALSTDLIADAVERGIKFTFLEFSGQPYAMLSSPLFTATVATRRAQLEAYNDERGVRFCTTIAQGKLRNQARLLKYGGKYLKAADPDRYGALDRIVRDIERSARKAAAVSGGRVAEIREELLGVEGAAGRRYWEGVRLLLKDGAFDGRAHRGARDPVNALLNYGYGILYSKVWTALLAAGLEPFAGFLHVDRPGKPSLVLDCVEEFRQPVVDRVVFAMINKGIKITMEDGLLTAKSRRALADRVLGGLEKDVTFEGKRYKLKSILQMQARHLACFFRGEREYRCYRFKW